MGLHKLLKVIPHTAFNKIIWKAAFQQNNRYIKDKMILSYVFVFIHFMMIYNLFLANHI